MSHALPPTDTHRADMALGPWGLCFTDGATEAAYRAWRVAGALRFARLGTMSGIVAWCGVLAAIYVGIPEHFADAAV